MKTATVWMALSLAAAALTLHAQEGNRPPREGGGPGGQGGQGEHARPKPPLFTALDLNGDGTIDAGEMARAHESLKKLDKNGDGKLTMDELMPPRQQGGQNGQGGQNRQGGQGRQGGSQNRQGGHGQQGGQNHPPPPEPGK